MKAKTKSSTKAAAKHASFKVFADYNQFYLCDATCKNDLADAWASQGVDDRLVVGDGIVGVGTARNMDVPVVVEILDAAPTSEVEGAQHVTECSLPVPTGVIILNGPTSTTKQARRFTVPAGVVRVRVSHAGLDAISENGLRGKDRYHVAIWPGAPMEARVLRRWVEPERPPAPEIKAPKTPKQAVAVALQGRTDVALPKLIELSKEKSNALAAASAAEILAFRGDWRGVIEHAGTFIRDLTVIGACNVFDEMIDLLRRAGRETGDWKAVSLAMKGVPKKAAKYFHDSARSFASEIKRGDVSDPPRSSEKGAPTEEDLAAYRKATAEAPTLKRFAQKPKELHQHLFSLASVFHVDDDMIALFEAHRDEMRFEHAVEVARVLVKRGRADDAWTAIDHSVPTWFGGFVCSVAPVELIVDPILAPLMTADRCAKVLATPRAHD